MGGAAHKPRRAWLASAGLTLGLCAACGSDSQPPAAGAPPHVVLIVADDLGWGDVGYHGSRIRTPNIDRLAREGIELDRFYTSPICSPSRAALLTGRYPIRFGLGRAVVAPWRDFGLDVDEVTLPQVLGRAGYRHRALFGKWHLGHLRWQWHPLERGFTHFHGFLNGAVDYFTQVREGERDWHLDRAPLVEEGYATDLIADAACRFIREHASEGPLLVTVAFGAPHPPFQAPEAYLEQYDDLPQEDGQPGLRQVRAAMITCMDAGIGRILGALDSAGIAQDTLVWFLSDNGATAFDNESCAPLRGGKHDLFEGGIRVPSCVRWPRGLSRGRSVETPTAIQDVLPTLMRISGIAGSGGPPLDGSDLLDVLRGERPGIDRELFFYIGQDGAEREKLALLAPPWKLVVLGPSLLESEHGERRQRLLFDILDDPQERTDRSTDEPQLVEQLTRRLIEFRSLEPADAIAPYEEGAEGFVAPRDWIPGRPR